MTGTLLSSGAAEAQTAIYRLDLSQVQKYDRKNPAAVREAWDTLQVAASIQGNVNREGPKLFLRCMPETDDFWWDYLRGESGWLAGREVIEVKSLEELLDVFARELTGVVLYNADEPFASNVASTMGGAENRFVLRQDESPESVYQRLSRRPSFPTNVVTVPSGAKGGFLDAQRNIMGTGQKPTGSLKNDAYRWALDRYLKSGRSGTTDLAYFVDAWWLRDPSPLVWNSSLTNHDFYIAKRAFFFDLSPLPDETPIDDPEQTPGLDRETLQNILRQMVRQAGGKIYGIGGFVPWRWKYVGPDGNWPGTGGKRHPVDCEWEYSKLISAYNGYKDADALDYSGMANASFYQHFPLRASYEQPRLDLSVAALQKAGYLDKAGKVVPRQYFAWYCGDYDSSAWLNRFVPRMWADPARGSIPLNWPFNPNLARRAPQAMHYARTHTTANEWFMAGDNGAGYLNPGMLTAPRLDTKIPDGWNAWVEHNKPWFRRFGLTMTGFLIDGMAPSVNVFGFAGYSKFSAGGVGTHLSTKPWGVSPEGVPYAWVRDVGYESCKVEEGTKKVLENVGENLQFRILRSILNTPTWHQQVMENVAAAPQGAEVCFVSAPVFFELIKRTDKGQRP